MYPWFPQVALSLMVHCAWPPLATPLQANLTEIDDGNFDKRRFVATDQFPACLPIPDTRRFRLDLRSKNLQRFKTIGFHSDSKKRRTIRLTGISKIVSKTINLNSLTGEKAISETELNSA